MLPVARSFSRRVLHALLCTDSRPLTELLLRKEVQQLANPLMMRYAASRGNDRSNERMNDYDRGMNNYDRGMIDYQSREMPMQRPVRDEYDGGAESRYRGRGGRWKAGTRRSMVNDDWPMDTERRMDDDEEEGRKYKIEVLPHNVVQWPGHDEPYGERRMPSSDYRTSRQIGFGAMNNMDGEHHRQEHMMGRSEEEPMEFDRETAEHWVRSMRNEDKAHPVGGKWSHEMLKPLAQKYGIPTDGAKFWEFYAMTNAMYSDYGEVAKKFGITSPEFYACMAKAWMDDKDAEPDKTALYYEYIVRKD